MLFFKFSKLFVLVSTKNKFLQLHVLYSYWACLNIDVKATFLFPGLSKLASVPAGGAVAAPAAAAAGAAGAGAAPAAGVYLVINPGRS